MIKGDADAKATAIYADAYSKAPDFYRFLRTLEAYRKFIDAKTTLVLSGDSDLLSLLTKPDVGSQDQSPAEPEHTAR